MASPLKRSTNIFDALSEEPESKSDTPVTPAKKHKKSRKSSSEITNLPPRVPTPEVHTPSIDIAAEKLRRQNERNAQTEAALDDIMKSRNRSSRANKWKPFDFHVDDDAASQLSDSARSTPLDVHAKIFQPTPNSIRPATTSSIVTGLGHDHSANDEFQLIASRRSRTIPLQKIEGQTPAIAVAYNKKEINDVFGNDLPSPSYCQSHPGTQDGQIQFCVHPNGDISAQQWYASQYQWINVGQYSNIRKKTEGQLANDRLRGETEHQSLQQNSLAYFHAIAKQREASVMGIPFGQKEILACMPNFALVQDQISQISRGIPTGPAADIPPIRPSARNAVALPLRSAYDAHYKAAVAEFHGGLPSSPTPGARQWNGSSMPNSSPAGGLTFGSLSYPYDQYTAGSPRPSNHGRSAIQLPQRSNYFGGIAGGQYASALGSRQPSYTLPAPSSDHANVAAAQRYLVDSRSTSLQKENDSGSRSGPGSGGRTVMYDPLKEAAQQSIFQASMARESSSLFTPQQTTPIQSATLTGGLRDLDDSEPDIAGEPSTDAAPPDHLPSWAKDLLQLKEPPTMQNLNHTSLHVTASGNPPNDDEFDYEKQLRAWFRTGHTKAERHEELHQRILAAHASTASTSAPTSSAVARPSPGVIGPPSSSSSGKTAATAKAAAATSMSAPPPPPVEKPFNEDVTRLLIPLLENLHSYVQGPEHQRHGYWAPFTAPPEWAVDRSLSGNGSFFDDDWGRVPDRIGRDSRYRGLVEMGYRRAGGRVGSVGGSGGKTVAGMEGWSGAGAYGR